MKIEITKTCTGWFRVESKPLGKWKMFATIEMAMDAAKKMMQLTPPIDTSLAASIERMDVVQRGSMCMTDMNECDCGTCDQSRIIDAARKWDEHRHLLEEANQCLRSCYSVAERKGESVNWDSLQTAICNVLKSQHKAMYPEKDHSICCKDDDQEVCGVEDLLRAGATGSWNCKVGTDPDGVGEGWRLLHDDEPVLNGDQCKLKDYPNDLWEYSNRTDGAPQAEYAIYRRRIEAE